MHSSLLDKQTFRVLYFCLSSPLSRIRKTASGISMPSSGQRSGRFQARRSSLSRRFSCSSSWPRSCTRTSSSTSFPASTRASSASPQITAEAVPSNSSDGSSNSQPVALLQTIPGNKPSASFGCLRPRHCCSRHVRTQRKLLFQDAFPVVQRLQPDSKPSPRPASQPPDIEAVRQPRAVLPGR
jgi:hypothetical protein